MVSYEALTIPQLKEKLRKRGLSLSGRKSVLIERLRGRTSNKHKASASQVNVPSNVLNPKLYLRAKEKVKKRVNSWPSAYASGQLVQEYIRSGGKYKRKSRKQPSTGLTRWFEEEGVDLCRPLKKGGYAKCGRRGTSDMSTTEFQKTYPYCRPKRKVSGKTPSTTTTLSKKEIEKRCQRKRRNPSTRITR